jgi:hypothetical protein
VANHINYGDYPEGRRTEIAGSQGKTLWQNITGMAFNARLNLSAQARVSIPGGEHPDGNLTFKEVDGKPATEEVDYFTNYTYSAACVEIELDVLAGETTILRADVVHDGGKCLNPAVEVGQVEGSFVQGLEKRLENIGKAVTWHVTMKRSLRKALPKNKAGRQQEKLEHLKARVRAKVEHPFHVIKNLFRHRKTRYRGLAKYTAPLFTLFTFANLMLAAGVLRSPKPEVRPECRKA